MQQNKYNAPLKNRPIYPFNPSFHETFKIIEICRFETIATHEKKQRHDKYSDIMIQPDRTTTMLHNH